MRRAPLIFGRDRLATEFWAKFDERAAIALHDVIGGVERSSSCVVRREHSTRCSRGQASWHPA